MRNCALAFVLLVSCSSTRKTKEPERREASDPTLLTRNTQPGATGDLGTERTRPGSKTIDWPGLGTAENTTFLNGDIVVDRILREDGENMYGARVRLGNRSSRIQRLEFRFVFLDPQGSRLLPVRNRWHSIMIEPRGVLEVSDACRVHGAVAFELFVRKPEAAAPK